MTDVKNRNESAQMPDFVRHGVMLLFAHSKAIILILILTVVLTVAVCVSLPPVYRGSFSVILKGSEIDTASVVPGLNVDLRAGHVTPAMVLDEERILTSPSMATKAGEAFRMAHPEPQFSWLGAQSPGWIAWAVGKVGVLFDSIPSRADEPEDDSDVPALMEMIEVTPVIGTHVLQVEAQHFDPQFTQELLEVYLDTYLRERHQIWTSGDAAAFFRKQADTYWAEWEAVGREIMAIKKDAPLAADSGRKANMVTRMGDLQREISETNVRIRSVERQRGTLDGSGGEEGSASSYLTFRPDDVFFNQLRARIGALHVERTELLQDFDEGSVPVTRVDLQLAELHEQNRALMQEALTAELIEDNGRRDILSAELAEMEAVILAVDESALKLTLLEEKSALLQGHVAAYEDKFQETRMGSAMRQNKLSNVSVVSEPYVDETRLFPNWGVLLPLSAVLGLFMGLAFVVLRELLDDTFRFPEQVARELDVPVVAGVQQE